METQKDLFQDDKMTQEYLEIVRSKYEGKYFKMRFGEGWSIFLQVDKILDDFTCKGIIIEISIKEGIRVVINTEDMPYDLAQFKNQITKEEFIEAFKLAVKQIFVLDILPFTNYKHIKK